MAVVRYSSTSSFGGFGLSDDDMANRWDGMTRRVIVVSRVAIAPVVCPCVWDNATVLRCVLHASPVMPFACACACGSL